MLFNPSFPHPLAREPCQANYDVPQEILPSLEIAASREVLSENRSTE